MMKTLYVVVTDEVNIAFDSEDEAKVYAWDARRSSGQVNIIEVIYEERGVTPVSSPPAIPPSIPDSPKPWRNYPNPWKRPLNDGYPWWEYCPVIY